MNPQYFIGFINNDITIIIIIIWSRLCEAGREWDTLSIERPQPHAANPWKEEEDKIVGDTKERTDHANGKALALLLKPASPTPSNTGSLNRSKETPRGAKRFCDAEK